MTYTEALRYIYKNEKSLINDLDALRERLFVLCGNHPDEVKKTYNLDKISRKIGIISLALNNSDASKQKAFAMYNQVDQYISNDDFNILVDETFIALNPTYLNPKTTPKQPKIKTKKTKHHNHNIPWENYKKVKAKHWLLYALYIALLGGGFSALSILSMYNGPREAIELWQIILVAIISISLSSIGVFLWTINAQKRWNLRTNLNREAYRWSPKGIDVLVFLLSLIFVFVFNNRLGAYFVPILILNLFMFLYSIEELYRNDLYKDSAKAPEILYTASLPMSRIFAYFLVNIWLYYSSLWNAYVIVILSIITIIIATAIANKKYYRK